MIDIILFIPPTMTIDRQQDPPQKKTQHETNASARASPVRALPVCTGPASSGGQINSDVHASCWSTAKMNRSKKAFFVRARSIATNKSTSSAEQSHNMMLRGAFFEFFFCWGEGTISPEPNKDDGARCCGKGISVPHRAHSGNKTQQSKRELHADLPRKEKEKTIKMDFFFVRERAPILQSQRRMMALDAVARAPQCLVARAVGTRHNNPKESCVRIYQGKRKKQQSKWFSLSHSGEGAISQSQRKMIARDAVARAPHQCLSARVSKTQQ